MEWQPIETAPKDGTKMLVYVTQKRGGYADIACYRKGNPFDGNLWQLRREGFMCDRWSESPSHWMPLPAAPGAV